MMNKMIKIQVVFLYVHILNYTYSGAASIRETDNEKKH